MWRVTYWVYRHVWVALVLLTLPNYQTLHMLFHKSHFPTTCCNLLQGISTYPQYIREEQFKAKASNCSHKQQQLKQAAFNIHSLLLPSLQHAMTLAQEKGASTWLTTLPIDKWGFSLHKSTFRDARTDGNPCTYPQPVLVARISP